MSWDGRSQPLLAVPDRAVHGRQPLLRILATAPSASFTKAPFVPGQQGRTAPCAPRGRRVRSRPAPQTRLRERREHRRRSQEPPGDHRGSRVERRPRHGAAQSQEAPRSRQRRPADRGPEPQRPRTTLPAQGPRNPGGDPRRCPDAHAPAQSLVTDPAWAGRSPPGPVGPIPPQGRGCDGEEGWLPPAEKGRRCPRRNPPRSGPRFSPGANKRLSAPRQQSATRPHSSGNLP
ncbi:hypothetical protein GA0115254_116913 [Streptomyces sp. Ncost-T10-10d]|nr:hypothetical protein GA0115254_116913 [Streptomyces sp. Ncost-T10-10d]